MASSRAAAAAFASRLPAGAIEKLAKVEFAHRILIAVFGEFGCRDALIGVGSIEQHGRTLAVELVERGPAPGTVTCMAIFPTYRLLTVAKAVLRQPYPTRATVTLARA